MTESSLQKEISSISSDAKPLATSLVESKELQKAKRFACGNSDFKEVVEGGYQFVDKTLFIKKVLVWFPRLKLIIRPPGFGKTSILSMLRYFFDRTLKEQDNLFQGLNIWSVDNGAYREHYRKYPVIFLSLQDFQGKSFEQAMKNFASVISNLYQCQQKIHGFKRTKEIDKLFEGDARKFDLGNSLRTLVEILYEQYKTKIMVLIDGCDAPLREAYRHTPSDQLDFYNDRYAFNFSYYGQMQQFMDYFLGSLDDNCHCNAILMGILPHAGGDHPRFENVFTDSGLSDQFGVYFGFTSEEVQVQLRHAFGSRVNKELLDQVERHYGSYGRKGKMVFSPSVVTRFIEANRDRPLEEGFLFENYWLGLSRDRDIVEKALAAATLNATARCEFAAAMTRREFAALVEGKSIKDHIEGYVQFSSVHVAPPSIWSILVFNGYLAVSPTLIDQSLRSDHSQLVIPNQSIRVFYEEQMKAWPKQEVKKQQASSYSGYARFVGQDPPTVTESLSVPLVSSSETTMTDSENPDAAQQQTNSCSS